MKCTIYNIFLFLAVFALVGSVNAETFSCATAIETKKIDSLVDAVEKKYGKLTDLHANFVQSSYFLGLDHREYSKGEVFFKSPGQMAWWYKDPDPQRFIADGKTLWFYQPDLNQVTVGEFSASFSSDLPVSFLLGLGELRKSFSVKSACYTKDEIAISFQPLNATANMASFELLISKDKNLPIGAAIRDVGGNETVITFQEMELNKGVSASRFSFKIPRGADVIDSRDLLVKQ